MIANRIRDFLKLEAASRFSISEQLPGRLLIMEHVVMDHD